ncbi:hypothetical protein JW960_28005 [candidate division KSB1 bacterium]|nr:hypothetical protein [candidate division KSB1 bacterium]
MNDCLELKFDHDPTQKHHFGVVNARLTALDSTDAANKSGMEVDQNRRRSTRSCRPWQRFRAGNKYS